MANVRENIGDRKEKFKRVIEDLEEGIYKLKHYDSDYEVNAHFDDLEIEVIQTVESAIQHLNQVQVVLLDKINARRSAILDRETAPPREYRSSESLQQDIENLSSDLKEFQEQYLVRLTYGFGIEESILKFMHDTNYYKDQISKLKMELKKLAFKGRFMKFKKSEWFFMDDNILGSFEPCEFDTKDSKIETQVTLTKRTAFENKNCQCKPLFLKNGSLIISGKGSMQIWNKNSNSMEDFPIVPGELVFSLIELTGGYLAAGTDKGNILILDIVNTSVVKTSPAHLGWVLGLLLLPNNNLLSYSNTERSIKVWRIGFNFELTLLTSISRIQGLLYLATFNSSIVTFQDTDFHLCIRFWDWNDGRFLKETKRKEKDFLSSACFLPPDRVAVGVHENGIKILNIHDCSELLYFKTSRPPNTLSHLPSGHLVAAISENVQIYDPNTGDCLQIFPIFDSAHFAPVWLISVSTDGKYLCATSKANHVSVLSLSFS